MATADSRTGHTGRARVGVPRLWAARSSLFMVGLVAVVISAWGGIIPFFGPTFSYSADGSGSWHWNLAHTVLAFAPAIVGIFAGILILARTPGTVQRSSRFGLGSAGLLALAAGGWFVVGPWAWQLTLGSSSYLMPATPLRILANLLGYSFGPGLILVACGAFALGWAVRHQPPPVAVPAVTGPVASEQVVSPRAGEAGVVPPEPPSAEQTPPESPNIPSGT